MVFNIAWVPIRCRYHVALRAHVITGSSFEKVFLEIRPGHMDMHQAEMNPG